MTNLHRTVLFVTSVIVLALIVFPVFAQVAPIIEPRCGLPGMLSLGECTGTETFSIQIKDYAGGIITTVLTLIGVLAAFFLVVAAIQYITSTGDAEKAEKAKKQVLYALLGVALAGSAWIIVLAVGTGITTDLIARITLYADMLTLIVGVLAAAYLVVAAIQYIMSTGDAEKAEKAKRQVIYALLGVALSGAVFILVGTVDPLSNTYGISDLTGRIEDYGDLLLTIIGVLAAAYIIYAGYKYISSAGDEEAAATAKKQITFALIGVFIAGTARIMVDILMPDAEGNLGDTTDLITRIRSIINAILSLLALIAAAYIILGGVMYLMSQGDQDKTSRAKMQIFYAMLGIAIVSLSAVLVNFIIANI